MASTDSTSQQSDMVPRHVAIIMDGNNRWAKQRGLKGVEGHKAGAKTVKSSVEYCGHAGVEVLTVFAFSSENWQRPEDEVNGLMELFVESLQNEVPDLHKNGIRLEFIGDLSRFSEKLQKGMAEAMEHTRNNDRMRFMVAINYGGQWDIVNAAKNMAQDAIDGKVQLADMNEEKFNSYVSLGDLPPLDLCIRTGGEYRISNFLLWQAAYAELYFSDKFWPDFDSKALQEAFDEYASRQRRFGRTSEQVEADAQN